MKLRLAPTQITLLDAAGARLALINYLLVRRHAGTLILRLDDADPEHARPEIVEASQQDLRWFGLDWDETITQSSRLAPYAAAADRLKTAGRLYPCFESEDELTFKRELRQRQGKSPLYDRAMLKMTGAQRAQAEAGGKRPYWRFLLSGREAMWGDMVLGRQSIKLSALSDPVLIRADGTPLRLFTEAVDDFELGMTHVVHDAERLTATGMQLDILAALGARPHAVRFAHLPTLTSMGRAGKRAGLPSVRSLRADGIEPAALCGTLARLGTPDPPSPEPAALLASHYDLTRIDRITAPRFDPAQLLATNRAALRSMPFEAARDRLPPAATPAFWHAVRDSLDLLREAREWWDVVAGTIVPPIIPGQKELFRQALDTLPPEPWGDTTWRTWAASLATDEGAERTPLKALRLALTGEDDGPELDVLLPLMGRARVSKRLRLAAG